MKRILTILFLFGLILNNFGQSVGEYDEVIVNDELTVRDSTLIEIIEAQTSGTTLDAQSGVNKNGNFFELGTNPLLQNTDIPGGLYDFNLGTVVNKINTLTLNGQNVTINSDNSIFLTSSGSSCEWNGLLLVCGTDTIATLADVRAEVAAQLPLLPFNFGYTFSASTADSRPGAGLFRFNNATLANVTQVYVDYFDSDNISQSVFLSAPDTGSYIAVKTDVNNYALYQLTGALTDAGNYYKYAVTYLGHNGVISGSSTIDLELSNNVGGVGGGGFNGNRLDTLGINDSLWVVNAWLDGVLESSKFPIDTLQTNVFIIQEDTLNDVIALKDAVEAESFDIITTNKINLDTILTATDTISEEELHQTVRKILYPNDYYSYLPNDSLYTTPSITLNTPTKILIPTAIKYARNWALFDKGGSDIALQFQGVDSSRFHLTMTTSMRTSSSNVVFEIFMYKNEVLEPGIAIERKIGTGTDVGAISVTGVFDVAENDYIEVYILVDVTTTVTFSKTSIVIKEDGAIQ